MFWTPCGCGGGGVGGWGWGVVGGCPLHTCAHAHTCTHAHACVVNMIISCKWPPPLGEYLGIPYDVICAWVHVHVRACACVCTWVGCTLSPPPPSTHPPTPQGGTPGIIQNSIALETNRDISILFEDLKSVETSPPMGGCIIWWVGGWVDGWGQVKTLKFENC